MRFTITGGVCNGYQLLDEKGNEVPLHFENMWDAIHTRDALNSGQWKLSEQFMVEAS